MLVDEYDKPILDSLGRPEVARKIRDALRNLYSVIKDSDAHIRFGHARRGIEVQQGVAGFEVQSLLS